MLGIAHGSGVITVASAQERKARNSAKWDEHFIRKSGSSFFRVAADPPEAATFR
jgi:hypothetical protein